MKFQYFSDVHIDHYPKKSYPDFNIQRCAPYLIIAGDIGDPFECTYERFLETVSKIFDMVFITSGNHEYYKCKNARFYKKTDWMEYVDNQIRSVVGRFHNVIFLQNTSYTIDNIVIYGSTLWSDILKEEECRVVTSMNDYTWIPCFSTKMSSQLYNQNILHLTDALSQLQPNQRMIVVTHHLPSFDMICEKYRNSGFNSAFASDVKIRDNENIIKWVAGHTHVRVNRDKFVVNPIGYPRETSAQNFNEVFEGGSAPLNPLDPLYE